MALTSSEVAVGRDLLVNHLTATSSRRETGSRGNKSRATFEASMSSTPIIDDEKRYNENQHETHCKTCTRARIDRRKERHHYNGLNTRRL